MLVQIRTGVGYTVFGLPLQPITAWASLLHSLSPSLIPQKSFTKHIKWKWGWVASATNWIGAGRQWLCSTMGANKNELANSLWLRLQLILGTDREVIHLDKVDFAFVFILKMHSDCASVVCFLASQQGGCGGRSSEVDSFLIFSVYSSHSILTCPILPFSVYAKFRDRLI